jgi:hypothetical protein
VVERWDLATTLPVPLALAGLDGERLAWIGAEAAYVVLLRGEGPVALRLEAAVPALDRARAVGLSGRALVVGARAGVRVAYLLDPGAGGVAVRDASRVPSALVAMVDGSVVELASTGASLRREAAPTPHDAPPATLLFAADEDAWVLDPVGAGRWSGARFEAREGALVALEPGARVDLRALRASRWSLALSAEGRVEIRVLGVAGVVSITIDDVSTAIGSCVARRARGSAARVELEPGSARLEGEAGIVTCELPLEGPFGLAFGAREAGAVLRSVQLARR